MESQLEELVFLENFSIFRQVFVCDVHFLNRFHSLLLLLLWLNSDDYIIEGEGGGEGEKRRLKVRCRSHYRNTRGEARR